MFVLSFFNLTICQTDTVGTKVYDASGDEDKGTVQTPQSIKISVDPRIELLSIVQILSSYHARWRLMTSYDLIYKKEVENYFSKLKDHPVIATFDSMSVEQFTFDAPPALMLHLTYPDFKIQYDIPPRILKKTQGSLNKFLTQLRDFSERSKFQTFFNNHVNEYKRMVEQCNHHLVGVSIVQTLENYFGMQQNSYNIILVPLMLAGGYGVRVKNNGKYDIYHLLGPNAESDEFPVFREKKDFEYRCWHEFSHPFVNPTTDQFSDKVKALSYLYKPISKDMKRWGYRSWESALSEHIVRAVENRLFTLKYGKSAGEQSLNKELDKGFLYIGTLCKELERYERNRDKYPTFVDFYPDLLNAIVEK